jgi:hypothetical protein
MELAMHCRDSDLRWLVRREYGSEWTVFRWHWWLLVAFPGSVRQQLLEPGEKPHGKVAFFGRCYSLWWSVRVRQRSRGTCSSGLASPFNVGCRLWRTACSASELLLASSRMSAHLCQGCWRSYGFMRPVLKHGPRSLTCVRVFG